MMGLEQGCRIVNARPPSKRARHSTVSAENLNLCMTRRYEVKYSSCKETE